MNKRLRLSFPILLALAATLFPVAALHAQDFSRTFSITPAPSWALGPGALRAPTHGADAGERYLLVDHQENVATGELYVHIVKELATAGGVQDGSTIAVDYDPSYQALRFHRLDVVRAGIPSSRLSRKAVSLLRREPDLESSMLDGAVTASFVLKDVRPGDRVDYAYTIRGRNPALGNRFADSFTYGWEFALGRERIRILCPASRTLYYRAIGGSAQPRISRVGSMVEYLWEFTDTVPILSEDDAPSWHVTYPWVEISEFRDWAAMVQWARSLFPPARLPAELEKLTAHWRAEHAAPEDRLQAALDYVQREIRYVAVELGVGSFRPRPPQAVFEQRFGDCKDKAYLLVTLLSRLGLEASPVLVNTRSRALLRDRLPSPYAFDHAIVAVSVGGKRVFADPTDAYQRGPALQRFVPDFGYGLMAAAGQTELLPFGSYQGRAPEMMVVDTFTSGGQTEPALLQVETTAVGRAADDLRADFATHTIQEMSKSYLNYYAADYPNIEPAGTLDVKDDPDGNVFKTVERYRIPGFWTLLPDKRNYKASFFPTYIYDVIPMPQTKIRASPIAVEHPRNVHERIEVNLPEPWPVKAETTAFDTPAFELKADYSSSGTKVVLDYRYRSRADAVSVSAVPAYNQSIKEIDQSLGYRLTWQGLASTDGSGPPDSSVMLILVLSALLLAAGGFGGYRLAVRRPSEAPAAALDPRGGPSGLGGWLVLVAIGLVLRPFSSLLVLGENWASFSAGSWFDLTNPSGAFYNPLWAPYHFHVILSSLAIAAASVLLLVLFFQRRRRFPALFIGLLAFEAAAVVANVVFTRALSGQTDQSVGADLPRAIPQALVGCAIWIPYMLSARRVKNTFDR